MGEVCEIFPSRSGGSLSVILRRRLDKAGWIPASAALAEGPSPGSSRAVPTFPANPSPVLTPPGHHFLPRLLMNFANFANSLLPRESSSRTLLHRNDPSGVR